MVLGGPRRANVAVLHIALDLGRLKYEIWDGLCLRFTYNTCAMAEESFNLIPDRSN